MRTKLLKLAFVGGVLYSLIMPGTVSAGERRGADIVVTLNSGHQVNGELIAVKPNALLLLGPAGGDEAIGLKEIESVKIPRGSRALNGALYGFLGGAVLGAMVGRGLGGGEEDLEQAFPIFGVLIVGAAGGLIGGVVGASSRRTQEIYLAGKSETFISGALAKLNRLARKPDAFFAPR